MSVPGVIPSTCGIAVVPGGSLPQELGTARISIKKSLLVLLVLGTPSRFLEQPVQVIYLLIFYVNIFHHINIGGKSLYISHII